MLKLLFSLFGCSKAPTITTESSQIGPFTIETITRTGKTWNMNHGRVNYSSIGYDVKYKGTALTFDHLETNTAIPGIWRVFSLKEAPVPTLILGSQSLYLVIDENEKANIKPIWNQESDFASIQWLDSEEGQPGTYREVYSSDEYDIETELSGGRYMAVTHAVVLDTKTLEIFPYNTNNEPVDGYSINSHMVLAFSPDSTQLIHVGHKQDEQDYMVDHFALLCYNFRTGARYAVPFEELAMNLKDWTQINNEWVLDFFEWAPQDDHSLRLTLKELEHPLPRKGLLKDERFRGYQYVLDPVKSTMINHLSSFIKETFQLDDSRVYRIEGDYLNRTYFKIGETPYMLVFGEYGNDLVFKQEQASTNKIENKELISRIAKGFNALLSEGKYQNEFEPLESETTE